MCAAKKFCPVISEIDAAADRRDWNVVTDDAAPKKNVKCDGIESIGTTEVHSLRLCCPPLRVVTKQNGAGMRNLRIVSLFLGNQI